MEKAAPDIAYRRLKYVSDWSLVEEKPAGLDRIVHRYRRLGAVLLDPDAGDDYLTARATRATLTLA
ncbi:MAG: hypothetical protein OXC71_01900 [Chloroflexi bacterium]|nr:hypothetical protein [Chloroflexota bacterium]